MTTRALSSRLLPALLGVATFAAAIPAAALTIDEIAMYKGADRQKMLEEGARKEGALVWYCTMREDIGCRPMDVAFTKKYPFIKAQSIASDSSTILQRNLAEARAKAVKGDIIQASVSNNLAGTGLWQRFYSPEFANYDPRMIDPAGNWATIWEAWNGITWNTKQIATADAPKTWEALLDPKYRGKLYWGSYLTAAPRQISHFRVLYGEDKAIEYLKKLQANDIRIAAGDAGALQAGILAGEYPILVGSIGLHQISPDKAKGAPVDGVNPDPALARTSGVSLIANAPHPHAAILFLDYLLSVEGQKMVVEAGLAPTRPGVEMPQESRWYMAAVNGVKEIILPGEQENAMYEKSSAIFQQMFK